MKEKMGLHVLTRVFYAQDPVAVAQSLLGRVLIRKLKKASLEGKIVETEAYYGRNDPASRECKWGRKSYNDVMWGKPGIAFIFMVHGHWLFNVTTGNIGEPSGVLIRAIEPLAGLKLMMQNRKVKDVRNLTSGPGKLTKAMSITKEQNGIDLTDPEGEIIICGDLTEGIELECSHRIGVLQDLPNKLRFYVKNNSFVSK